MRVVSIAISAALVGCPGKPPATPALTPSGPTLPAPRSIDPSVRGASYLTAVAAEIQPAWHQFLEDCRLRLPKDHPLNSLALVAIAELAVRRDGRVDIRIVNGSGNGDFDTAAFDVAADAGPFPAPPADLLSDDDRVHVRWMFARDARQAGPATAQVLDVRLPLVAVVERLIEDHALGRAIDRVAIATDLGEQLAATEKIMVAVLREGLYSENGMARREAVDAVARANVGALISDVHMLTGPIADLDLRIAAIAAAAQLRDPTVASTLAAELELGSRPRLAFAKLDALVALGRGTLATPAIRRELAAGPTESGLLALGRVPDPELAPKLSEWMSSRDARTRGAVCEALPAGAPTRAPTLIAKGLRDADASVRAKCSAAIARGGKPGDPAAVRRLKELARDRDQVVRAQAIATLGVIEPGHRLRNVLDPSPAVRVASAVGASEAELRVLAGDADPDVRAAALSALGDRAPELAHKGVADLSATVRRTSIPLVQDERVLERLVNDPSPEVATAALIQLASRRGRATITRPFLVGLGAAPEGTTARVRIALAWLLAR